MRVFRSGRPKYGLQRICIEGETYEYHVDAWRSQKSEVVTLLILDPKHFKEPEATLFDLD
jgi:hypothetical protein